MDLANVESREPIPETQIQLPLEVDHRYNVVICIECCTGVAFDWIPRHLKTVHGIKKQLDWVMESLNIEAATLSSVEIKAWMSEAWVLDRPIQGVQIKKGMRCTECNYCGARKEAMKDHFTVNHPGLKWTDNSLGCNVQMPFNGCLKKYIQIEDVEGQGVQRDPRNDWKQALDQEFQETMVERTSSTTKGVSDIRLSSAFIAKMRWDICVKDMDLQELQNLAKMPVRSDRMFQIILCGRKYIEKCCGALNGGNMMVRRRLMSIG